jgi:hypothetical protein
MRIQLLMTSLAERLIQVRFRWLKAAFVLRSALVLPEPEFSETAG